MKIVFRTRQARRWQLDSRGGESRPSGVTHLMQREKGHSHWAHEYAARLMRQVAPEGTALIQSSMSPTGAFHIGNFRDTATAYLVHRAVRAAGRRSRVLLSFDDFDPVRRRPAELVAGSASRPLAERPASAAICHDYLDELRAMGLCPPAAAPPGHGAPVRGRGAAGTWQTHFQAERYRAGEYLVVQRRFLRDRRRIARHLGVAQPEKLFAPYCLQCGRNTTTVVAAGRGAVRYGCRSCGAYVHTADLRDVKPVWALDWAMRVVHEGIDCEPAGHDHCSAGSTMDRTQPLYTQYLRHPQPVIVPYGLVRQDADRGKISGSRGGGLRVRDLLRLLPPPLILWMYAVPDVRADLRVSLAPSAVLRLYDEYDRFTAAAALGAGRARDLWSLLSDEAPPGPSPGFRRTLGALSACLFDVASTTRQLIDADAGARHPTDRAVQATRSRVELAWRAAGYWPRPGWLPAVPVDPDIGARDAAARAFMAQGPRARLDRSGYRAVYAVLFGGLEGPSVRGLVARFGAAAVLEALQRFVDEGARPLRERALANLAASAAHDAW